MDIEKLNKTPLGSKKFIFAGAMCTFWMGLIALAIVFGMPANVLEAMIWAAGATSSLYLGGQSVVDSLVRATAIKYGGHNGTVEQ